MSNVTKDGVEVKVGQTWKSCDVRTPGKKREVIEVADGKAKLGVPGSKRLTSKVRIDRMHKHSTGWELVS